MNRVRRINPIVWVAIGGTILLLVLFAPLGAPRAPELEISQVLQMATTGQISKIQVEGDGLTVLTFNGEIFSSRKETSVSILEMLEQREIDGIQVEVMEEQGSILGVVFSFLPLLLFAGLFIFFMRRAQGGGVNQITAIGRSQATLAADARNTVTFDDVAGADEPKQELEEIVEFLKYPQKFTKLGARIPKGVLLVGPPGTGKTLISRAVAGEAGVPFFSISGSQFVEMFVGVGASRVRDLFAKAREASPSIVFIDEIDAVGRSRGVGIGGGNDEREQTLNQILVEMDGFDERTNVIIIAATNRPDVLDPALLRPGRFDRRVSLDLPDVRGRQEILSVHLKGKPILPEVDILALARQTHGFSGADLANLANEAAILTARADKERIGTAEFGEAIDRVIAGPARRSRAVSEKEREVVAYHEAGHALVAARLPHSDPVDKVTIVARGAAGGYTRLLPDEDRGLWTKGQFEAQLAVMMGGQTAEELALGDITTGASNDLQNANQLARKMVTEYGMSSELGPRTFDTGQNGMYFGRDGQNQNHSDAVAEKIDAEIGSLLDKSRLTAKKILESQADKLAVLAKRLLIDETVDGAELSKILADDTSGGLPAAT